MPTRPKSPPLAETCAAARASVHEAADRYRDAAHRVAVGVARRARRDVGAAPEPEPASATKTAPWPALAVAR